MVPDYSKTEVQRRIDRLKAEFDDVTVDEWRETVGAERFQHWVDMAQAGYLGGAYALIRRPPERLPPLTESMVVEGPERERVLLMLPRGGTEWGLPGGGQEGEETLEATARREVREEVGLEVSLTDLEYIRHEIGRPEDGDGTVHAVRAFFHAVYEEGSISIQAGEVNGAAWFAEPPALDRLGNDTERMVERWEPPRTD